MVTFPTSIQRVIRIAFEGQAGDRNNYYSKSTYWKFLMDTYGDATNFHGFSGISLPSYIQATAGTNNGVTNDFEPKCKWSINNIYDALTKAGLSYENYAEPQGNTTRHTPGYFYTASCNSVIVDSNMSSFVAKYVSGNETPKNLTWITPNLCNCCHDCHDPNVCANWLKNTLKLDTIFKKSWFTDGSTVIMLVEDDGGNATKNAVCIFCSTESKGNKSSVHYDHISELSTVMWLLGLTVSIADANPLKAMKDLFGAVPPPLYREAQLAGCTAPTESPAGQVVNITLIIKQGSVTENYIAVLSGDFTGTSSPFTINAGTGQQKVVVNATLNTAGVKHIDILLKKA